MPRLVDSLVPSSSSSPSPPPPYDQSKSFCLYRELVLPGCLETRVDHLWSAVLLRHFQPSDGYMIEREAYASEGSLTKIDIMITNVVNGHINKAIFVECRRPPEEGQVLTRKRWSDLWLEKKAQLERYMKASRADKHQPKRLKIGMLCIGRLVKFYNWPVDADRLEDWALAGSLDSIDVAEDPELVRSCIHELRLVVEKEIK